MEFIGILCFLIIYTADGSPIAKNYSDVERLRQLETLLFEHILEEYPEYATSIGNTNYDGVLDSYSTEAFERRQIDNEKFLQQLDQININNLTKSERIDYKILYEHIRTFVDGHKWKEFGNLNPINFLEGQIKHTGWLKTEQNFTNFLRHTYRIKQLPLQIKQQINLMRKAIELNKTNHNYSMLDAVALLKHQQTLYFIEPFVHLGQSFWSNLSQEWEILLSHLSNAYMAFNNLITFINSEYLSNTRRKEGISSLLGGVEYYEACLKYHLGINMTAKQIHEKGLKEVQRISHRMHQIMENLGFNGTLQGFFAYLQAVPEFYNHTKSQLLQKYEEIVHKDIEPKLWSVFKNVSMEPVRIVPMHQATGFWGAYKNNTFMVSVDQPHLRSSFTMVPLSLHETNPGHHFQENYFDKEELPEYRRWVLYGRRFAVPFNYPTYTAYIEGWALYSEFLGEELGLYEDPYDLFGRYCSEILRACRLVVDTGIHAFGWTKDAAVNYIYNFIDFPKSQISKEVDRYITWPGHACAYKIGEMKIKELREKAQNILGNSFDVKEFHDQVLRKGPITLNVLEDIIDEWISDTLAIQSPTIKYDNSGASPTVLHNSIQFFIVLLIKVMSGCLA